MINKRAATAAGIAGVYLMSGVWRGFLMDPVRAAIFSAVFLSIELAAVWQFAGLVRLAARLREPRPGAGGPTSDDRRQGLRLARRGSLVAIAVVLVAMVNCSANGVISPEGTGFEIMRRAPDSYYITLLGLSGPLLALLAIPALLVTGARPSSRRVAAAILVSGLSAICALITAYAGFLLSYAVFCTPNPSPARHAQCVAGAGALAAAFGVLGCLFVIPPLQLVRPPGPIDRSASGETTAP